jgi:hypothetical protein
MAVVDCLDTVGDSEADLFFDPGDAAQVFGLARSCREAGALDDALRAFRRRAGMGGAATEVWYSLYQVAVLSEALGHPEPAIVSAYLTAYHHRPTRAEPLVALAAHYRLNGARHVLAYLFAREAITLPAPVGEMFVEEAVYAWRALDEYAVAAYWTGRHGESAVAGERLLDSPLLPRGEYARVNANLAAARAALAAHPDTAGPTASNAVITAGVLQRQRDTCPDPAPTASNAVAGAGGLPRQRDSRTCPDPAPNA